MNVDRIALWRRTIGAVGVVLGLLFFACTYFIYVRYFSDVTNLHAPERLEHARLIGLFWTVSFYGAALWFVLSLVGLGWSRWIGLFVNGCALLCGLATLGAMSGPFAG